jgi:hypothetical protein
MRLPRTAAWCLLLCLVPAGPLGAQTPEIQDQVETQLWLRRLPGRLETTVAPPLALFLVLIAAGLLLYAARWLWKSRRPAKDGAGREGAAEEPRRQTP